MTYRTLGRTGIQVSSYCLGTMNFGMANKDHDEGIRIIHKALGAGINFVDTADMYGRGESELIVGKALKGRRDGVVLTTKVHGAMGDDPNQRGNSRRWIIQEVEASLRRLQTDYIDVYLVHRPSPETDIEETLSAMTDLLRSGKVRTIGTSTFPASDLIEAQWVAERRGLARFRVEQPPYSILNRGIEREVLPLAQKYGMGVMVWSPLAKGMLTGRYRRGAALPDTLRAGFLAQAAADEVRMEAIEALVALADEVQVPLPHLALAFTQAHPAVTSTILGPRTMDQFDDLMAGDFTLTDELLDRIDRIVRPGTDAGLPDASQYVPPAIGDPNLRRRSMAERRVH